MREAAPGADGSSQETNGLSRAIDEMGRLQRDLVDFDPEAATLFGPVVDQLGSKRLDRNSVNQLGDAILRAVEDVAKRDPRRLQALSALLNECVERIQAVAEYPDFDATHSIHDLLATLRLGRDKVTRLGS